MKETEISEHVRQYLINSGYDVYQEVTVKGVGVIDIVCVKDGYRMSVECKTSANITVLFQADKNKMCSDFSCIAIPYLKPRFKNFVIKLSKLLGIGIFEYRPYLQKNGNIIKILDPVKQPEPSKKIVLLEKQKDYALAGNNEGKRWTPFMQTVHNITEYVKLNQGCEISNVVDNIEHHYKTKQSAVSSIKKRIKQEVIKTITISNNKLYLK